MHTAIHTGTCQWEAPVWLMAWDVDRTTLPVFLARISFATAPPVRRFLLWQVGQKIDNTVVLCHLCIDYTLYILYLKKIKPAITLKKLKSPKIRISLKKDVIVSLQQCFCEIHPRLLCSVSCADLWWRHLTPVKLLWTESSFSSPAPCPPTNIEAFRDCDANRAVIVWQNHQSTGLYTATIADQSADQLNCTSNTGNNCTITSLPCGKKYNVSVTYNDGNCPSASSVVSMDSGTTALN